MDRDKTIVGYPFNPFQESVISRLATIAANKNAGAGMPWDGCDTAMAFAGSAAVGGGEQKLLETNRLQILAWDVGRAHVEWFRRGLEAKHIDYGVCSL